MAAPAATGSPTSRTSSGVAGRSCTTTRATGPPEVFGGITTLHFGRGARPYLLLPVVPPAGGGAAP